MKHAERDHPIHDRVLAFLEAPADDGFEPLALEVFQHQLETIAPYRESCARRGASAMSVRRWPDIPPVPVAVFKEIELRCGAVERVFRSSGTTAGAERRSIHAMPDLRLYRAAALGGLKRFL